MLYDRGPIDRILDADFPRPSVPANFSAIAFGLANQFELGVAQLAGPASTLAEAGASDPSATLGQAIGTMADELDRQSRAADPAIAGVATNTDTLEGTLAGLTNETGGDLASRYPIEPNLPRGDDLPPDYAGDQWSAWDTFTIGAFASILGRGPTPSELVQWRSWFPDVDAARRAIESLRGQAPPASEPAPSSGGGAPAPQPGDPYAAGVRALYLELLGREPEPGAVDVHRGNPNGLEGVRAAILASDEYRARHGG